MKRFYLIVTLLLLTGNLRAADGYDLWLRYHLINDTRILQQYRQQLTGFQLEGNSPVIAAAREELARGLKGLLGKEIFPVKQTAAGTLLAGTPLSSSHIAAPGLKDSLFKAGNEGFLILNSRINNQPVIIIAANTDIGVLYGVFHFLRLLQTHQPITGLNICQFPKLQHRLLNHWDNLDRTVERGYAGFSIWDWHKLPDYIDPRYKDYARTNASIGINGTVLTNVNANALVLTPFYLQKVAALAAIFRPYGIKVYLTARFSAPSEIGGLPTSDPLDDRVKRWWKEKADEIYRYIPDFGGLLVKANSEGQPGPQTYNRTHAEGANILADALEPHGGIVMWRAFVYSADNEEDRFKQAYNEFNPLDGKFRENVLLQVKNGPIDFQPREPFHPLFGSMSKTPLMMEFQVTQEYLGFATHLVYLATLFKECLGADTYALGKGSSVAKVIDGSLYGHHHSGMAGVANIGTDRNWTGHPFGQANWYALGRLAWDHSYSAAAIAEEWIRQTFTNHQPAADSILQIMMASREAAVNYMTPLGLHHLMGYGHHYGPAPWYDQAPRADWNPVYFHQADASGIGFDRTATGSNALSQYAPEVRRQWSNPKECPEEYLLWFHHVSWNHSMPSGRNLWQELCYRYQSGVASVRKMQQTWHRLKTHIDRERFEQVSMLLGIQEKEAVWWRDASLLYFQTFSKMPFPAGYEKTGA